MRCPKCQYISYDNGDRCRNCGYEFSLSVADPALELPIQTGAEAIGPLKDFPLSDPRQPGAAAPPTPSGASEPRAPRAARTVSAERRGSAARGDLPLFTERALDHDAPLVSATAVPRVPLSVRRANPVIPRPRGDAPEPELNLEMPDPPEPLVPGARRARALAREDAREARPRSDRPPSVAPLWSRTIAGVIDAVILGAIDGMVVYLTLRVCGFTLPQILLLPPVPMLAFLLLLDGGYLAVFTAASGQTIGKMAAGVRVVQDAPGADRVRPGQAAIRAAASMISILPAGLGVIPALFSPDRRTLHDWLADTRVVNA